MVRKYRNCLPYALAAVWFALPLIALADTTGAFVPLAKIPSGPLATLYSTPNNGDFSNFINSIFKFTLAVGAIAAVLRIAYAGYLYMGSDMWSHKGDAKKIIGDVTLGLLLLLGVYLILYQINPDIVKLNALKNITPVQQQTSSGQPAPNSTQFQQGTNTVVAPILVPSATPGSTDGGSVGAGGGGGGGGGI